VYVVLHRGQDTILSNACPDVVTFVFTSRTNVPGLRNTHEISAEIREESLFDGEEEEEEEEEEEAKEGADFHL
jgi:hypothetical protein